MTRFDMRNNTHKKHIKSQSAEMRTKRDQTFSGAKGSISKFGFHKSNQPVKDAEALLRAYGRRRISKAPVTLVTMPWDGKKSDG